MTSSLRLRSLSWALVAAACAMAMVMGNATRASAGGPLGHAFMYSGGVMTDLGTLPGDAYSDAADINGAGQVVGFSVGPNLLVPHAFLWSASSGMVDLNALLPAGSGWTLHTANGINDAGQITGTGETSPGSLRGYILKLPPAGGSASIVDIGTMPGGTAAESFAINSSGQVVGRGDTTNPAGGTYNRAFLYSSGTMTNLGAFPGAPESVGLGINDLGAVAGISDQALPPLFQVENHAFLFTNGAMVDLGQGGATGVNNAGDAVGWVTRVPAPDHAALFQAGAVTDLGTLPGGTTSHAAGINAGGTIVGSGDNASGLERALIFGTGGAVDIGTLPGMDSSAARRINAGGQIVGVSYTLFNTPLGNPTVTPFDPVSGTSPVTLTFTGVTQPGLTTLFTSSSGPPIPGGTAGTYYYLSTTAVFSTVAICITDPSIVAGSRLLHFDAAGVITDITAPGSPDVANHRICSVPLTSLSPFAIVTRVADTSPPVTSAAATPAPNAAGWNRGNVTVVLTATDPDGAGDVARIHYSATGAQVIAPTFASGAVANVVIAAEGLTTLSYFADDGAGNTEAAKSLNVRIDRTPPTVSYTGNAGSYTVDQAVNITCIAADPANASNGTAGSGLASTTCQDVTGAAYSFGAGSHAYSATALDRAGNAGGGSTTFTVQVTFGSLCVVTKRFIETSPRFIALPPGQQALWDQAANWLCQSLASAKLANPAERARLIAGYQAALPILVRYGFLTPAQASTLLGLSKAL